MFRTLLAAVALLLFSMQTHPASAGELSYSQIARGKYLTDAGDCVACHTSEADKPFSGGRPVPTPFGTIYSANITPDRETGIGAWSDEDFYNAMHFGRRPTGEFLYPAFPYPYFTHMSRGDTDAILAYLKTLKPVRTERHKPDLIWPLGYRPLMRGWNWLFFEAGQLEPNANKSDEWNRGAYLVEGPGHCGACHTPKNIFGADKSADNLEGSKIQNWFAPKLLAAQRDGLADWTEDDLVEFLKTGRNRFDGATGLMAEVVEHSTSKMNDQDLHAIAVYLRDQKGPAEKDNGSKPDLNGDVMAAGKTVFASSCAACHKANGDGVGRLFPPLKASATVQQKEPTSVIRVILEGARTVATASEPTAVAMPAFGWKLSDAQIAAVATFVRNSWGNEASAVSEDDVKSLRKTLRTSMLPNAK